MNHPHDPVRLVGRTVLLREHGESNAVHVNAAGLAGISVQIDDESRFIAVGELADVEFDADDGHIADAAAG